MIKVYYASSCSQIEDKLFSELVNEDISEMGFDIYTPATNDSINDKRNNPTPAMIYDADMDKLEDCGILLVNINGGHQDGTIFEVGAICLRNQYNELFGINPVPIIPFTRNQRLLDTQIHNGLASASVNHLVLGGLEKWSDVKGLLTYEQALERLKGFLDE